MSGIAVNTCDDVYQVRCGSLYAHLGYSATRRAGRSCGSQSSCQVQALALVCHGWQSICRGLDHKPRDVRVCCRRNVRITCSVSKSHQPTPSRAVTARVSTASQTGHFEQKKNVVALMVALRWSACLLRTVRRRRRRVSDSAFQSALCLKFKERHPIVFQTLLCLVRVSKRQPLMAR